MEYQPFAQVEQVASKLTDYGLVGILILVIIVVMAMLLKHVLDQVKDDRKMWAAQSDKFLTSMTEMTKQQLQTAELLKSIKDDIDKLREDFEDHKGD